MQRTLREITFELENLGRAIGRIVINQDDLDHQLALYDRRRAFLEKEKARLIKQGHDDSNEDEI